MSLVSKLSWARRFVRVYKARGGWYLSYFASPTHPKPQKEPLPIGPKTKVSSVSIHSSSRGGAEFSVELESGKVFFGVVTPTSGPPELVCPPGCVRPPDCPELVKLSTPLEQRDGWVGFLEFVLRDVRGERKPSLPPPPQVPSVAPEASSRKPNLPPPPQVPSVAPEASSRKPNLPPPPQVPSVAPEASSRKPNLPPPPQATASPQRAVKLPPPPAFATSLSKEALAAAREAGARALDNAALAPPPQRTVQIASTAAAAAHEDEMAMNEEASAVSLLGKSARDVAPPLPDVDAWVPSVPGSGGCGFDHLLGTQQPGTKSLADVVRELRRHKAIVVALGGNGDGQLGSGAKNASGSPDVNEIKVLSGKNTVVGVSAGSAHVAALTESGQVFVWGDGQDGQLGVGEGLAASTRPYLLRGLRSFRAVSVACGAVHTLVALDDGQVMSFGDGTGWGVLGSGALVKRWEPAPVVGLPAGKGPCSVFAGRFTSGCVFSDGSCFMWGCNSLGQCCQPIGADSALSVPHRVTVPEAITRLSDSQGGRIVMAACGDFFTLFVVGSERVLAIAGWANVSRHDQESVLLGDRSGVIDDIPDWALNGGERDDSVFALRPARESPMSGRVGLPEESDLEGARCLEAPLVGAIDVAAGDRHGAAVLGGGHVMMIGRGIYGLGKDASVVRYSYSESHAEKDDVDTEATRHWVASPFFVQVPTLALESPAGVSCGSKHTLVGTRGGRVFGFGSATLAQTGTGKYGWTFTPELATRLGRALHHVEGIAAGGDFSVALVYPGTRGENQARELARKYAGIWMEKTLGRSLGEAGRANEATVESIIDEMAAELARDAGLEDALLLDPELAALLRASQ
jgi:alpha-tubulin suppressor-like RCC1 family protein